MKHSRWIVVIVSTLSLVTSGCARNSTLGQDDSDGSARPVVSTLDVVVTNNNFRDMKVYLLDDGGSTARIGTVTGLTTATLKVRRSMIPEGILRLIASPIGGTGVAQTGMLNVTGARVVNFNLQTNIAASYGLVR